jgi:hypothetical protein
MWRINALVVLALFSCPIPSRAEDKKEARSQADEAAYLTEKSGKREYYGWVSEEVMVSYDGKTEKGKLRMVFRAEKGKPGGELRLMIDKKESVALPSPRPHFELVETDGKRHLKIYQSRGPGGDELEYTIDGGKLTVR